MMIPMKYNTKIFTDIWDEASKFEAAYKASPLYDAVTTNGVTNYHNSLTDANITLLYYMLYARYGNSPIANLDENQFKFKVYSLIFQYGPTWQKELDIQDKLRGLNEEQLLQGAKAIYNKAYGDSGTPSTQSLQELEFVNEQNTTNYKKTKLGAYSELLYLLKTNVSEVFLNRFRPLFKKVVAPEFPILYKTNIEENDEEEIEND